MYRIINFFTFLGKLWSYGKILWKDRDWDYYHIFPILYHKLQRTRLGMAKDEFIESKKDQADIRIAEILIERIMKDEYTYPEHCLNSDLVSKIQHIDAQMDRDIKYLFKHISKHIRYWWT